MNEDCINISSLTVHYDDLPALIDINVNIKKGMLTAIIGPNGSGKSTLMKAILNLVKTTSGKVSFFGKSFDQVRGDISYISQTKEIDWDFPITIEEVVMMGAYSRVSFFYQRSSQDLKRCHLLLKKFGLYEKRNELIAKLSGGQKQRLFLARAFMQDSLIYIFDEPMAFVDFSTSELILQSMQELKQKGKTVICIHHNLEEVKERFDEAILLAHYLVDSGKVEKVLVKENLNRAYRVTDTILTDAFTLSKEKESGIK